MVWVALIEHSNRFHLAYLKSINGYKWWFYNATYVIIYNIIFIVTVQWIKTFEEIKTKHKKGDSNNGK